MKIEAVITRNPQPFECIAETETLATAIGLLKRKNIGSVGVVSGAPAEFRGLLTQTEIVSALAGEGCKALGRPVAHFLRSQILICGTGDKADKIMQAMTVHRHRHAVVKSDEDKVVGLVSLGDLAAIMLDDARLESSVLRDMACSGLLRVSL